MNLTPNFTLEELTRTDHQEFAVQNLAEAQGSPALVNALTKTAQLMEQVRAVFNAPVQVHSGFRCEALNEAVGSNPNSQHRLGEACDFTVDGMDIMPTVEAIRKADLTFHQLLIEGACVHIGTWRYGALNHEVAYWASGTKVVIQAGTA